MDASTLANLLAYSAQVACIAAAGSLLPVLLRIDAAGVRHTYWRALLVVCLALPWLQGRHDAAAGQAAAGTVSSIVGTAVAEGAHGRAPSLDWIAIAGGVLAAGAMVRLIWLAAGLLRLRRLRTAGQVAAPCAEHDDLQRLIARAEIRYVPALSQPVTFGAWRPVVLLPEALRAHPPQIRQAVLCHELFHVQRRDWLWVLAEEAVRAALWFHPGVWWLISRVQLSREEVVDELAVLATGRRRAYIEALMAFSDDTPLAPAAAFARKRHLFRRMVLISKEAVMSSRRIVVTGAVMAMTIAAGSWYAVAAFPMVQGAAAQREAGALEKQARPITPENPIPARLDAPSALYPADAAGAQGSVTLRVTLDNLGRVAEARPVRFQLRVDAPPGSSMGYSNPTTWDLELFFKARAAGGVSNPAAHKAAVESFVNAAAAAIRQWRYDPPKEAPITFDVTTVFTPDAVATATQSMPAGGSGMRGGGGRGGISMGVAGGVAGGVVGGIVGGLPQAPPSTGQAGGAIRVGGNIKAPTKVRHVNPVYPETAQAARVQGVVIIEATVGADGTVIDTRVLRSIPLLDQAAIDAVQQWEFTPTLLNGQAVPVIMTMTVNFTLSR